LWPRQAPFFESPTVYEPSLHNPVASAGLPVGVATGAPSLASSDFVFVFVGASAVDAGAAAPAYHSLMPLWPRQAPFFESPE
jgi:hypothetical protein